MNIHQKKLLSSLTLKTLVLTLFLGLSTIYLSRNTFAENITPEIVPGTTNNTGGGTRGTGCLSENQKPLTPLIPKKNNKQKLTLTSHPTIYIYVPETKAETGNFILKDSSQKNVVYEDIISISNSPGIIGIKIPTDQPGLKVSTNYNWTFNLICTTPIPKNVVVLVEGSIQRVNPSPDLTIKLKQTPENEHWLLYSNAGIWYEALVNLAEQIHSNQSDTILTSKWQKLLNLAGLNEVATEPLRQQDTED